jgi:hypothetical protein
MEKEKAADEMEKILRDGDPSTFLNQMLANPLISSRLSQLSGLTQEQLSNASQGRTLMDLMNTRKMSTELADFGGWISKDIENKEGLKKFLYDLSQSEELNIAPDFNTLKAHDQYTLRFGRSFHKLTPLHTDCLKRICQLYTQNKTHPLILDIPSGDGVNTVRMIAAGGQCLAVDQNTKAIDDARTNIKGILKFLPATKKKGRAQVCCGDALQDNPDVYKENHYDIVWCSNFLPFLSPAQAEDFVAILFKTTNLGANVYIQAEAPMGKELYEYFCENQRNGYLFPGFGIFNYQGFYKPTGQKDGTFDLMTCVSEEKPVPVSYDTHGILPGNQRPGYYGQDLEDLKAKNPNMGIGEYAMYLRENGIAESQHHNVYNYFDIPTLSGLLKRGGFLIQDAYYFDGLIKIDNLAHSIENAPGRRIITCIMAQKPNFGGMVPSIAG